MIVKPLSSPPKNEEAKDEENVASTSGEGGALKYMLFGERGRILGVRLWSILLNYFT